MSIEVTREALSTSSQAFKLQYATNTGGPWTDVGFIGSTTSTWRGYDNTTSTDGAVLPVLLLTESDVAETYEEANPTALNPNQIAIGQWAEWDWVVQENGASANATYYFRMVKSDGTALNTYTRYPTVVMPPH